MGKNTEIKLVSQPILSQVLKLVDKSSFDRNVKSGNWPSFNKAETLYFIIGKTQPYRCKGDDTSRMKREFYVQSVRDLRVKLSLAYSAVQRCIIRKICLNNKDLYHIRVK